jgi:hypothetical protein
MAEGAPGDHPFAGLVRKRGGVVVEHRDRLGEPLPEGARFTAWLGRGEEISPPVVRVSAHAYLLSAGRVGGSEEEPLSREIPTGLVARVLDAALLGQVEWEVDPDFGFELPMAFPGMQPDELLTLVPRFLYARTDRVYEYSAMVPAARGAGPT